MGSGRSFLELVLPASIRMNPLETRVEMHSKALMAEQHFGLFRNYFFS